MKKIVPIVAVLASVASLAPASFTASMMSQAHADAGSTSHFHARGPVQALNVLPTVASRELMASPAAVRSVAPVVPGLPDGAEESSGNRGHDGDSGAVAAQRWMHIDLPQPRSLDALTRVAEDIQT
ncbi:MAG: hypothetical protein ACRYG5_03040 [Janthinobacterium lividum]